MTYQEYLLSEDWQRKREQKFREARHRCAICQSRISLEVHHLIYRNWFDVQMSDLRRVIGWCTVKDLSLKAEPVIGYTLDLECGLQEGLRAEPETEAGDVPRV